MIVMTKKRLLLEVPAGTLPCGHLFQLWVEGDTVHIHAECDDCERMGLEAVHEVYPELPVQRVD